MAGPDVEVFNRLSTDLPDELEAQVDVTLVSNFFEHLRDKDGFPSTRSARSTGCCAPGDRCSCSSRTSS